MLIRLAVPADAAAITAIYNQGIAERSATFETAARQVEEIRTRLEAEDVQRHLVASDAEGNIVGWANISGYGQRACYAGIGEFSIYLDRAARGQGIGRLLLDALIARAGELGYWKLLSRIFLTNTASRTLCQRCGFREVGIYEKHARLEGRWLDVVIVERLIEQPLAGVDHAQTAEVVAG